MLNESAIRHLAGVLLEKVPAKIWDFEHVATWKDGGRRNPFSRCELEAMYALKSLNPECGAVGCAVGVAGAAFNMTSDNPWQELREILGMEQSPFSYLFGETTLEAEYCYGKDRFEVTAPDVGRALLRYLDEGPWWGDRT